MKASDASVIIPAYGPAHFLDACLAAIDLHEQPKETLVWDNGTKPAPAALPEGRSPRRLLGGEGNLGFAAAINRLAAEATGDILVLLNVDTEVQAGWLDALVEPFAGDLTLGITGSRLVHPSGELQCAGVDIHVSPRWVQPLEVKEDLPTRFVDAVCGAAMAVSVDTWSDLAGLDEGYVNGNEDIDFALRAHRSGWRIKYVRESLVLHHESATGSERWAHLEANIQRLQRWTAA
jgi:GT2 family glycosyltransferase